MPEIVADVIFALSGYAHHRSNNLTTEQYKQMLIGQNTNTSIASKKQVDNYQEEGWKYDDKGIAENLETLRVFSKNFRFERDAKATPEEDLKSKMAMIKDL